MNQGKGQNRSPAVPHFLTLPFLQLFSDDTLHQSEHNSPHKLFLCFEIEFKDVY